MNKAFSNFTWENDPSVNTPLSAENLNRVNNALNEVDNRVVNHETTKANQTDMLTALTGVSLDEDTGIFTFTRHNGTKVTLDTRLEKVIMNWNFDSETQTLYLILQDGTEMPVDLSAFITNVEFVDSTTIRAVIGTDGKVAFEIIDGSITSNKLQPNYLADIQLEATKASQSATNAQESAESAEASAVRAEEAAQIAQSVSKVDIATTSKAGIVKPDGTTITVDTDGTIHGVGGGGDVTQEDLENYLPLSGGILTDTLRIFSPNDYPLIMKKEGTGSCYVAYVTTDENDGTIPLGRLGFDVPNKPSFRDTSLVSHELHHTGNKPSGTYTGNGSATERTIDIGGGANWSDVLTVTNAPNQMGYVTRFGGVFYDVTAKKTTYFSQNELYFDAGKLVIKTSDMPVNSSGSKYYYRLL